MSKAEVLFHIARQDGLEFVFTSGNALCYPMHTHVSVYTITVVRKGAVRLIRKRSANVYPEGSIYVVAPHEPHSPNYTDTFDIVSLCIKKDLVSQKSRFSLTAKCLEYADRLVEQKLLGPETVRGLVSGIDAIYDDVNLQKPFATSDALLCHLSRFHFIRKFKSETGLTPHQCTVQNRIRKAKELLAADTPLADTAVLAGFCDQSHLNRWFKRTIGITPRLYKKSCFFLNT